MNEKQHLQQFVLFNILLVYLLGARYLFSVTFSAPDQLAIQYHILIWSFVAAIYLSQLFFMAAIPIGVLGYLGLRVGGARAMWVCAVLAALFVDVFVLADSFTYAIYHFHLQGVIWQMILGGGLDQVLGVTADELWAGVVLILVLTGIQLGICYISKYKDTCASRLFWRSVIAAVTIWLLASLLYLASLTSPFRGLSEAARAIPWYTETVLALTPLDHAQEKIETRGQDLFRQVQSLKSDGQYPLHPLKEEKPKKPLNVVFILIDAWRFNMLRQDVAPHIYQFSKNAWQFDNHFSGGNCTRPGVFSIFYSLPGTYWASMLQKQQGPLLFQEFMKQGYDVKVLASADQTIPPYDKTVFRDIPHFRSKTPGEKSWQRDKQITSDFIAYVKQVKQPFFSVLFYNGVHMYSLPKDGPRPFKPWKKHLERYMLNNSLDPVPIKNRYQNALYAVDGLIGDVFNTLKKQGMDKNTVVIVTGDHGEEFNDTRLNYWGHASNYTHYQIQTPLLIKWPGQQRKSFKHLTTHYDLAPFLMKHVLGVTNPIQDYSVGEDLRKPHHARYFIVGSYIDYALVEPDKITRLFPSGRYEVYDRHWHEMTGVQPDSGLFLDAMKLLRQY